VSTEFPLDEIETPYGRVVDPTVVLQLKTPDGYRTFNFVVDSGADYTVLPGSFAEELGVDLTEAPRMDLCGVAGIDVPARLADITFRIGDSDVTVPCLFSSNQDTPYLLGRMGFFSRFNVLFDNRRKMIVLETI
jgi:predicted aspartyl protease